MIEEPNQKSARPDAKAKLLEAALSVIRTKGYSATTVQDICDAAGVTKGAFFHHFRSKDDLAVAAADYWSETTSALFAEAPYHEPDDPAERLLAYVDFRRALLQGELPDFTCLVGTIVQEAYDTHPEVRDACARSIVGHAQTLEDDIQEALKARGKDVAWTPESLALFTQAVIQGAFVLAKATGGPKVAAESLDHLRAYLAAIFQTTDRKASP